MRRSRISSRSPRVGTWVGRRMIRPSEVNVRWDLPPQCSESGPGAAYNRGCEAWYRGPGPAHRAIRRGAGRETEGIDGDGHLPRLLTPPAPAALCAGCRVGL